MTAPGARQSGPLVLVTRPEPDAAATASLLEARGVRALVDPVMDIVPCDGDFEATLAAAHALLVTSANGARALARWLDGQPALAAALRARPAFAVGKATAASLEATGFTAVEHADADAGALAARVRARLAPDAGKLVHISGAQVAGDLAAALARDGFRVARAVLYEARAREGLAPATVRALAAGEVDGVLLYSRRTASIFSTLVVAAGVADALRLVTGYCLSPTVAEAAAAAGFGRLLVATRPDQQALLGLLETAAG